MYYILFVRGVLNLQCWTTAIDCCDVFSIRTHNVLAIVVSWYVVRFDRSDPVWWFNVGMCDGTVATATSDAQDACSDYRRKLWPCVLAKGVRCGLCCTRFRDRCLLCCKLRRFSTCSPYGFVFLLVGRLSIKSLCISYSGLVLPKSYIDRVSPLYHLLGDIYRQRYSVYTRFSPFVATARQRGGFPVVVCLSFVPSMWSIIGVVSKR